MIVTPPQTKPLALLHLLHGQGLRKTLCFTKSVESARRLGRLVELFESAWESEVVPFVEFVAAPIALVSEIGEDGVPVPSLPVLPVPAPAPPLPRHRLTSAIYSSSLPPAARLALLTQFRNGTLDLLIASDLIARGVDLEGVENVICYDVALDMAKYVHRVGRTARAGRDGVAWSLVETQEVCSILPSHDHSSS